MNAAHVDVGVCEWLTVQLHEVLPGRASVEVVLKVRGIAVTAQAIGQVRGKASTGRTTAHKQSVSESLASEAAWMLLVR